MSRRDYLKHLGFKTATALFMAKENNTPIQLPAEVEKEIADLAHKHTMHLPTGTTYETGYALGVEHGIEIGATAYATRLFDSETRNGLLKTEAKHLNGVIEKLEAENAKLKEQATGWRTLLEEVLKLDDLEIAYISEDLINKIKKFLYGDA